MLMEFVIRVEEMLVLPSISTENHGQHSSRYFWKIVYRLLDSIPYAIRQFVQKPKHRQIAHIVIFSQNWQANIVQNVDQVDGVNDCFLCSLDLLRIVMTKFIQERDYQNCEPVFLFWLWNFF